MKCSVGEGLHVCSSFRGGEHDSLHHPTTFILTTALLGQEKEKAWFKVIQ